MTAAELTRLADLLRRRNELDEQIAGLIGRPMVAGHVGEWIASRIFGLELADNAVIPAYDGWFTTGGLAGRTVNVKWSAKQESLMDMSIAPTPDYYLLLTGPRPDALATPTRPWVIEAVHLFSAEELLAHRQAAGVKIGVATSVPHAMWSAAEVYPHATNPLLRLRPDQVDLLRLFGAGSET